MKKYAVIYQAVLMENLQYAVQIMAGYLSYFVFNFICIQLWNAVYETPGSRISGYTKEQMIWYVMTTELILFSAAAAVEARQVSQDIRRGNIAYQLNKPYEYPFYMLAKYTGEWSVRLPVFAGFAAAMGVTMAGRLPGFHMITLAAAVPCIIAGITIHAICKLCISLFSFWIEDAEPFQWIYDKLILVTGTIFPIEVFPKWLQPFLKMTPVYTVCYGPAKLITDFSMEKYAEILLMQAVYLAAGFGLMFSIYQKGVKRLYVNGG